MSDTKSPTEWADELVPPNERWKHTMADQSHGWSRHKYETAEEMKISQPAYEAAIETVVKNTLPHRDAMSEYAPVALKERADKAAADKKKAAEGGGQEGQP